MISEEEFAVAENALRDEYPGYFELIDEREVLLKELSWLYRCPVSEKSLIYFLKLMVTLNSHRAVLNLSPAQSIRENLKEACHSTNKAKSLVLQANPHYYAQINFFPKVYNFVVKFSRAGYQEMLKNEASRYGQYFFANMVQPYLDEYEKNTVTDNGHTFLMPTTTPTAVPPTAPNCRR